MSAISRRLLSILVAVLIACALSIPSSAFAQGGELCELAGVADLHNHQFSNLGFGGKILWGDAFGPADQALRQCAPTGGCAVCHHDCNLFVCEVGLAECLVPCVGGGACTQQCHREHQNCLLGCEKVVCEPFCPPHGHGHGTFSQRSVLAGLGGANIDHSFPAPVATLGGLGAMLGERATLSTADGFPSFGAWPNWNTYTHQQVWAGWLKRAHDSGLRLMVMLAVSNQVLCEILNGGHSVEAIDNGVCNDMVSVLGQLKAARLMDAEFDWYQIVESPQEAREAIAQGRLAVVLGAEVDSLFDCFATRCSRERALAQLDKFYELGLRHVFPMHVWDNGLGGAAVYSDFFNFGNFVRYGQLFPVRDCSGGKEDYQFTFGASGALDTFLAFVTGGAWSYAAAGAHCNSRGLTGDGEALISAMMDRGMLIDVDHMSARMRGAVLNMAEDRNYPLVSSHTGYTELYELPGADSAKDHEGNLKPREVDRMIQLGGMFAPIHTQGKVGDWSASVANDCPQSSRSWAQAYEYTVDQLERLQEENPLVVVGVGVGSDFNGLAGQIRPRFGLDACDQEPHGTQGVPVTYPIALHSSLGQPPIEGPQRTGWRDFDFNIQGYAHVGLLPEFVQDLRNVGLSEERLTPLFRSAEAYIQMWEKATNAAPAIQAPSVQTAICSNSVQLQASVEDDLLCFAPDLLWQNPGGSCAEIDDPTLLQPTVTFPGCNQSCDLELTATDRFGQTTIQSVEVRSRVDDTPPTIQPLPVDLEVECDGSGNSADLAAFLAAPAAEDECEDLPVVNDFSELTPGCAATGSATVAFSATDLCGQTTTESATFSIADTLQPELLNPPADFAVECDQVPPPSPVLTSDVCDPSPSLDLEETRTNGICAGEYRLARKRTVTDACGLSDSHTQIVTVHDTNPPVIEPGDEDLYCLWPPSNDWVCFDASQFAPVVTDACSEPLRWSFTDCSSGQGASGGHEPDCRVDADGQGFCVRSEREGGNRTGRRYSIEIAATDECGNASASQRIGFVHVPHDQRGLDSCLGSDRPKGRR